MMPSFRTGSLFRTLRRFGGAQGGNIAVIYAILLVPLLSFIGAAVDYSRYSNARTAMQAALDSASLMVSKDLAKGAITSDQVAAKGQAYFNALYTNNDATGITVTTTYTAKDSSGSSTIVMNGAGQLPTDFMRVAGYPTLSFSSGSTATWGGTRLRVALVLDTTGSMNTSGKMSALQSATKSLLSQLKATAQADGDVYVSIIPFAKNVNLGSSNYNASWIDWTQWEAEPDIIASSKPSGWDQLGPGGTCPFTNSSHGFVCAPNPTSTSTTSSIPSSGTYKGYICPATDGGNKDTTKIGILYNGCYTSVSSTRTIASGSGASCGSNSNCSCSGSGNNKVCTQSYYAHNWVVNAHNTWGGCVTDRGASSGPSGDYDRLVTAPGSSAASKFPAEQNAYCPPATVMGMSYDWTALNAAVDSLAPLGATNQPVGLVWGWQSLVGGGPLSSPAKDPNYKYTDAILLMSDGLNTLNRWSGDGGNTSTAVDQRMYQSASVGTCANIKAASVSVYTVQVNTDGDPTSTLLQNCASTPDQFFLVTSSGGIASAFNAIGANLSKLRVSK